MKSINNNSGMTLMLALLILAIVLASAAAFTTIIIRELKQTRAIENSMLAYYYAESGAEKSLHQIRIEKENPDNLNNDDCDMPQGCSRQIITVNAAQKDILYRNQTWQIDLFNPDDLSGSGVNSVQLNCTDDDIPNGIAPFIKLNILEIETDGQIPEGNKREYIYGCNGSGIIITNNSFDTSKSYIVNIQVLYDDVSNLQFTAFNGASPVNIASLLQIDLRGQYQNTVQKIKITMPQRSPLSSLFDWVIFSETDLVKTITSSPSPPPPPPPPPPTPQTVKIGECADCITGYWYDTTIGIRNLDDGTDIAGTQNHGGSFILASLTIRNVTGGYWDLGRILLYIDVSNALPADINITSAKLYLHIESEDGATDPINRIYKIATNNSGWVEGTSVGVAQAGTACYKYKAWSTQVWPVPGGGVNTSKGLGEDADSSTYFSEPKDVGAGKGYTYDSSIPDIPLMPAWNWVSVDITPTIQAWYDTPSSNTGLLIKRMQEGRTNYHSSETSGNDRPYLEITYTE